MKIGNKIGAPLSSSITEPEALRPPGHTAALPPAQSAQIYIDFDGTLTQADVIDQLIFQFAVSDRWKEFERLWARQEIGSAECLREELALVRISDSEFENFLGTILLDPGAERLLALASMAGVPITVLSDGLDQIIESVFARHEIAMPKVRCNKMIRSGGSVGIEFPHQRTDCQVNAGHCKCASVRALATSFRQSIYIGDGQSDFCAARQASVVFAKGRLATLMAGAGLAFYPFTTLDDVVGIMRRAWSGCE